MQDRSTGRWCLALWLLLCLSLVCGPMYLSAQTTSPSGISRIDLKLRLLKLEVKLRTLKTAWEEQTISLGQAKQLSTTLQSELDELRLSLANSRASLTSSREELAQSVILSETLQTRLDNLSMIFDQYQAAARRQILTGWIGGGLLGLGAGFLLGLITGR